jgi:hypothetical protein
MKAEEFDVARLKNSCRFAPSLQPMAAGCQRSVMCAEAVVSDGCRRMRFWRKVCLSGTFCAGALNLAR